MVQLISRHYLIKGRVQGVGFRRFVEARARSLGLVGAVRNLADGRVEFLARGDAASIRDFERLIAQGPALSQVTEILSGDVSGEVYGEWRSSDAILEGTADQFSVLKDGEEPWSVSKN